MRQRDRIEFLHDLRVELRHWRERFGRRPWPEGGRLLENMDDAVDRLDACRGSDEETWRKSCDALEEAWTRFSVAWRRSRPAREQPARSKDMNDSQTRKEYLDLARARLREWRARIDQLKVRSNIAALKAEDSVRRNVEKLDERYESLREGLSDVATAGDRAWQELRDGLEDGWKKLETEFTRAGGATG